MQQQTFARRFAAVVAAAVLVGSAAVSWAGPPGEARQRVAVLPFGVPRGQAELEQYGVGAMDSLISTLSTLPHLVLVDRSSMENVLKEQAFHQTGLVDAQSAVALGKVLGAQFLISGDILQAGGQLRINARFTNAETGQILRGEVATGTLDNIFDLMDQLSQKFTAAVGAPVTPQQARQMRSVARSTANRMAFEYYLRGRKAYLQATPASYAEAAAHFRKAIETDANYALAYVGLAEALGMSGWQKQHNGEPYQADYAQAHAASQKALALNPDLAEAHRAFGVTAGYLGKPGAEAAIRKAIELKPNAAESWYELWFTTGNERDPDHEYIRKALDLNPSLNAALYDRAVALHKKGRYQEAIAELKQALRASPNDDASYYRLGRVYLDLKQPDAAIVNLQKAISLFPRHVEAHYYLGTIHAQQARWRDAIKAFEAALKLNPQHQQARQDLARAKKRRR